MNKRNNDCEVNNSTCPHKSFLPQHNCVVICFLYFCYRKASTKMVGYLQYFLTFLSQEDMIQEQLFSLQKVKYKIIFF